MREREEMMMRAVMRVKRKENKVEVFRCSADFLSINFSARQIQKDGIFSKIQLLSILNVPKFQFILHSNIRAKGRISSPYVYGPLSDDQRDKLLKQREQYEVAAEKLEDQLLKLKQNREALKSQGNKHEDNIMKENAKLQKEVKYRIQYMKEYTEKIDKGLEEDAKAAAEFKEKEREKMWREQERAREELERKQRERDSSRDSSEEKERKKKKKKKEKSRTRSSSSSSDDNDRKKKKKKKKAKARSGSSDSSDSDGGRKKNMEDELFSMVAELTSKKKKSSGSNEDVLVGLMTKMTESYNKIKKENSEISARCVILENQNKVLKRQVEDLTEKLEKRRFASESNDREDKRRYASESSDKDDFKHEMMKPAPVPAPVPSPMPPPPSWGQNMKEEKYRDERYDERDRYRDDRERYGRDDRERYGRDDRDRYRDDRYRDDRRDRRDRDKERYRDDRRRERSRSRSRSKESHRSRHDDDRSKDRDKSSRDKNDKIDLKDWTQPPSQQTVDPSLLSLKEKMRAKEEEANREDELRNRWVTKEIEPTPPPEMPKINEQPLPENRSSIKMSWGQGTRKTPDPGPPAKKNAALVGKMPWVKNGSEPAAVNGNGASSAASAPRRSKFGPPVTVGASIPPPSLVTQAPTLAGAGSDPVEAASNFPPPPPPMLAPPPAAMAQEQQQQQPPWAAPNQAPDNNQPWYGYGGMPPPEMAQPPEPKVIRNPRPQAMDMNAIIAAAQQHMQKNLTAKLASIGVPMTTFGISTVTQAESPTDSIPLPEEPIAATGPDMDIIASNDIPLPMLPPIGGGDDGPPGDDDDCAPPGCD